MGWLVVALGVVTVLGYLAIGAAVTSRRAVSLYATASKRAQERYGTESYQSMERTSLYRGLIVAWWLAWPYMLVWRRMSELPLERHMQTREEVARQINSLTEAIRVSDNPSVTEGLRLARQDAQDRYEEMVRVL